MYLTYGTRILDSDEVCLEELEIADMATLNCSARLVGGLLLKIDCLQPVAEFRQSPRFFSSSWKGSWSDS